MSAKENLTFDVLIEIPKGSRNKYEYDFELKKVIGQWKIRANNVNKDILNLQLNFSREVNPVDVANNIILEIIFFKKSSFF